MMRLPGSVPVSAAQPRKPVSAYAAARPPSFGGAPPAMTPNPGYQMPVQPMNPRTTPGMPTPTMVPNEGYQAPPSAPMGLRLGVGTPQIMPNPGYQTPMTPMPFEGGMPGPMKPMPAPPMPFEGRPGAPAKMPVEPRLRPRMMGAALRGQIA